MCPSILLFITCKGKRKTFIFLLVGTKITIRGLNETVSLDKSLLFYEISWVKGIEKFGAQLVYQIEFDILKVSLKKNGFYYVIAVIVPWKIWKIENITYAVIYAT
jgi:hypothetical protein